MIDKTAFIDKFKEYGDLQFLYGNDGGSYDSLQEKAQAIAKYIINIKSDIDELYEIINYCDENHDEELDR
jgi:hypothetical protein